MTGEKLHRDYGTSINEWISQIPAELPLDAVGLWQLVPAGRDGFGLTGQDLVEFVRRSIVALLDAGAVPVRHRPRSGYDWTPQTQYGSGRDQMVTAIIREWMAMPDDPLTLCGDGVWFARSDSRSRYIEPV